MGYICPLTFAGQLLDLKFFTSIKKPLNLLTFSLDKFKFNAIINLTLKIRICLSLGALANTIFEGILMRTPDLLAKIDIPRQKLYYLEQKGYIKPKKTVIGEKEFREYTEEDVEKVACIWKYLKKGFKYKVAYEKAIEEIKGSQLDLINDEPSKKR